MFELSTSFIFLLGTFYGSPSTADISAAKSSENSQTANVAAAPSVQPLTLEQYVREYYKDEPILAEIARCESTFRHLGTNGKVLRGELTSEDLGVMQINEFFHEKKARELGLDIHSLHGNLTYAKWLYGKEGATPWIASESCWQKSDALAFATAKGTRN